MVNKKSSPTLLRVHEVDFGSMVHIDDDKQKTFCAYRIFLCFFDQVFIFFNTTGHEAYRFFALYIPFQFKTGHLVSTGK